MLHICYSLLDDENCPYTTFKTVEQPKDVQTFLENNDLSHHDVIVVSGEVFKVRQVMQLHSVTEKDLVQDDETAIPDENEADSEGN